MGKSTTIRTQTELAKRCKVARQTLQHWLQHDLWIFGQQPWHDSVVDHILRWRDEILNRKHLDLDEELKRKRIEKIEQELQQKRAALIERDRVDQIMILLAQIFMDKLGDGIRSLPAQLLGKEIADLEAALKAWVHSIRAELAYSIDSELKKLQMEAT